MRNINKINKYCITTEPTDSFSHHLRTVWTE